MVFFKPFLRICTQLTIDLLPVRITFGPAKSQGICTIVSLPHVCMSLWAVQRLLPTQNQPALSLFQSNPGANFAVLSLCGRSCASVGKLRPAVFSKASSTPAVVAVLSLSPSCTSSGRILGTRRPSTEICPSIGLLSNYFKFNMRSY